MLVMYYIVYLDDIPSDRLFCCYDLKLVVIQQLDRNIIRNAKSKNCQNLNKWKSISYTMKILRRSIISTTKNLNIFWASI